MGPSWLSAQPRTRRVILLCAALALIAGAAVVLALLSAPRAGVGATVSSTPAFPPPRPPYGVGSGGTFRRSPPYASPPPTVGPATAAAVAQATKRACECDGAGSATGCALVGRLRLE